MDRLKSLEKILSFEKHQVIQKYKPEFKEVYTSYIHSHDSRKPEEVKATVEKIHRITEQNLKRLGNISSKTVNYDKQKYKNCIFICLHGIPPYPDEFDFLNLPGECFYVASNGFEVDKDEQYIQNHLKECRFSFNTQKIHQIVKSNPEKDIVFVYHSFGTYNLSVYFHKYGTQRVKGLIEIGPAPIRHYRYATEVAYYLHHISEQILLENKNEAITQGFQDIVDKINKEQNLNWANFPSLTYTMAFLSYFKSSEFPILFDLNRKYPKVLKFIAFGEEDNVFQHDLICERAEFYSKVKLKNEGQLKKKFQQKYKSVAQNIQEKFIYMIPKGKHSLHLQKRIQPILAKAVQEYLQLLF